MDELMRPMSQFDAWMLIACLRVGFFVAIAMPATLVGVLCWIGGEYVGRRDSKIHPTLTDAEREAIKDAVQTVSESLDLMNGEDSFTTATLRNLLDRIA
jgi:hypothetical protein